jgi:hypothetical protein
MADNFLFFELKVLMGEPHDMPKLMECIFSGLGLRAKEPLEAEHHLGLPVDIAWI